MKKKISDVNYRHISFTAFGVKSGEINSYICKCHLHLALSSSWLGRAPHMHQRTLSCPRCVTGVCELVPGWGSVSSWNIYSDRKRDVIARLQRREGSWYPRVENKYLWKIPLASEHFLNACMKHTHRQRRERKRTACYPNKYTIYRTPFSSVIHNHCRWLKNASGPTATRWRHKETLTMDKNPKGLITKPPTEKVALEIYK